MVGRRFLVERSRKAAPVSDTAVRKPIASQEALARGTIDTSRCLNRR
ncbi:hypothetical protein [Streptomyces sp. NTH33]|nr:hypothetical protein [Streptomyces sp. NTH33]